MAAKHGRSYLFDEEPPEDVYFEGIILATVRYLNEAIFMAAEHPTVTSDATNALQSISEEIENKLLIIGDRLDEIREALA